MLLNQNLVNVFQQTVTLVGKACMLFLGINKFTFGVILFLCCFFL